MRQGSNSRRPRSRGIGRRNPSGRGNNVESNGPDVKIRGTAQQVLEKYLVLAQDASSAGDRVAAEAYFQYADHYYRVINGDGGGPNNGHGRDNAPGVQQQPQPQGEVAAVHDGQESEGAASPEPSSAPEAQAGGPETEPVPV